MKGLSGLSKIEKRKDKYPTYLHHLNEPSSETFSNKQTHLEMISVVKSFEPSLEAYD